MGKKITQNMDAYVLYLKARNYRVRVMGVGSLNHLVDYCNQAIKKDPSFAHAYALIAWGYASMGYQEILSTEEAFPQAESFAEKAAQLDDSIAESHLALAYVKWFRWDFYAAEAEFRRAVELDSSLVDSHLELSMFLAHMRRFDEALNESKRALQLDPLSAATCFYVGTISYLNHQYEKAEEMLKNSVELDPSSAIIHDNLGCVYIKMEMPEKAILEIRKAIELGAGILQKGTIGYATARAGREHEARMIHDELLSLRQRGQRTETALATVCIGLRDYDKAVSWLESAYEYRLGYLLAINCDPLFDDIRENPRFQNLLKKIGF